MNQYPKFPPPPFLDVSVFLIWPYFTLDPINKVILRQDVISECKRTRVWWFPTDLWKSHNLFIEKWSLIEKRETPSLKLWWVSSDSHCNFYIENGILWGENTKELVAGCFLFGEYPEHIPYITQSLHQSLYWLNVYTTPCWFPTWTKSNHTRKISYRKSISKYLQNLDQIIKHQI